MAFIGVTGNLAVTNKVFFFWGGGSIKVMFSYKPSFSYLYFSHNSAVIPIDASIPEADLLKAENETLQSMEFLEEYADVFKLFGLILRSEGKRVYVCVKTEADESNKW